MSGRSVFFSLGAVASAAIGVSSTIAAATPVTVQTLDWQFYQGGSVYETPTSFEVFQQHFSNMASNHVTGTLGGARFDSFASILHTSVNSVESFDFGSFASLSTEAAVTVETSLGSANAFSTLSMYSVSFLVSTSPVMYQGLLNLEDKYGGTISPGDVLDPGTYTYTYFNTFGVDAGVDAGPGESLAGTASREFRFEFSTIPAPGAAAMIVPAALVLARRRRR